MRFDKASAARRGVRRFVATGAIAALSGTALVAAGSGDVGAINRYTRECFKGLNDRHIAHLNGPLVDMAVTRTERGCWLAASDGGVFSIGDAPFYGSAARLDLVSPVVGFTPTSDGQGYWLVAADGGVFNFGDAPYYGSAGGAVRANPMVGIRMAFIGDGYVLTDSAGKEYGFHKPAAAASSAVATVTDARKAERKTVRKATRKVARKGLHHPR
jgi:hypothetical protein